MNLVSLNSGNMHFTCAELQMPSGILSKATAQRALTVYGLTCAYYAKRGKEELSLWCDGSVSVTWSVVTFGLVCSSSRLFLSFLCVA
jgi:hypothetical protein